MRDSVFISFDKFSILLAGIEVIIDLIVDGCWCVLPILPATTFFEILSVDRNITPLVKSAPWSLLPFCAKSAPSPATTWKNSSATCFKFSH